MKVTFEPSRYALYLDGKETRVTVESRGFGQWAVSSEGGFVLSPIGEDPVFRAELAVPEEQKWIYEWEPMPSGRSEEFIQRTRFNSVSEAVAAFEEWAGAAPEGLLRGYYRR